MGRSYCSRTVDLGVSRLWFGLSRRRGLVNGGDLPLKLSRMASGCKTKRLLCRSCILVGYWLLWRVDCCVGHGCCLFLRVEREEVVSNFGSVLCTDSYAHYLVGVGRRAIKATSLLARKTHRLVCPCCCRCRVTQKSQRLSLHFFNSIASPPSSI